MPDSVNLFRKIAARIATELRMQRLGRRSLREVQFRKYKAPSQTGDRLVRDRLLRRLPRHLGTSVLVC